MVDWVLVVEISVLNWGPLKSLVMTINVLSLINSSEFFSMNYISFNYHSGMHFAFFSKVQSIDNFVTLKALAKEKFY